MASREKVRQKMRENEMDSSMSMFERPERSIPSRCIEFQVTYCFPNLTSKYFLNIKHIDLLKCGLLVWKNIISSSNYAFWNQRWMHVKRPLFSETSVNTANLPITWWNILVGCSCKSNRTIETTDWSSNFAEQLLCTNYCGPP